MMESVTTAELATILIAVISAALTTAALFWAVIRALLDRIDKGDMENSSKIVSLERRAVGRDELNRLHSDMQQSKEAQARANGEINARLDNLFTVLLSQRQGGQNASANN